MDKDTVIDKIENGELKVKKSRAPKAEHKGPRGKLNRINPRAKNTSHRSIIFSHSTALFSIPSEIRDKARLDEMYNSGLGATVTYDAAKRCIAIKLDEHP
jgi:hypothetical protein